MTAGVGEPAADTEAVVGEGRSLEALDVHAAATARAATVAAIDPILWRFIVPAYDLRTPGGSSGKSGREAGC